MQALRKQKRIACKDRYQTALTIAKEIRADNSYIVLADGDNFADFLSAAPIITENNGVLLLTKKDKMSEMVKEFFASHHNLDNVYIIGGTGSISEKTFESIATEYIKSISK